MHKVAYTGERYVGEVEEPQEPGGPAEVKRQRVVNIGPHFERERAIARMEAETRAARIEVVFTAKVLDRLVPSGYVRVPRPASVVDVLLSGYSIPVGGTSVEVAAAPPQTLGDLTHFNDLDARHFAILLDEAAESGADDAPETTALKLLLRIKNGTTATRKNAVRALVVEAPVLGAKAVIQQLLLLVVEPLILEQERHVLLKVLIRVLVRLGPDVEPYISRLIVVATPLLAENDRFARADGAELLGAAVRAAGLSAVLTALRPDVDHNDEHVRGACARALAVVASTVGIVRLVPFLRAVCLLQRWTARHTGARTIQHMAVACGHGLLPFLALLVGALTPLVTDQQGAVRVAAASAVGACADAAHPYGIERFAPVLEPVWNGVRRHRGRQLAVFLRTMASLIRLMDPEYALHYAKDAMAVVRREFTLPDDEMQRSVLVVVERVCGTEGVPKDVFVLLLPELVANFWTRRVALDRRLARQVVATTRVLAARVGAEKVLARLVPAAKDMLEPLRRMAADGIEACVEAGLGGVDAALAELLVDAALQGFQEQSVPDPVFLKALAALIAGLGSRAASLLPPVLSTVLYRMGHADAVVRGQAAELAGKVVGGADLATVTAVSTALYEALGEPFPDTLAAVLGALTAIIKTVGVSALSPGADTLVPALTPILRNRHEKVQELAVALVGVLAARAPAEVHAREWMRVVGQLVEMLRATRKGVRRAANATFGHVAAAIGPADVLGPLLNTLRVQERQLRVCAAVAIAIVAERCGAHTVLPVLMNEYRTPDANVQHGVLKAMAFMFEHIGPVSEHYVYASVLLLEDALTDRDSVHRQQAAGATAHLAVACAGRGKEEAFVHLLNLVWPNVLATLPQVVRAVDEALAGLARAVGAGVMVGYLLAGLFHPARQVRQAYWRVYNEVYVGSAPAMVPHYPVTVEEDDLWV